MPFYDYRCTKCRWEWEVLRPTTERDQPIACPVCDEPAERIYIGAPIIPWYPDTTRSPYKEKRRHH